MFERQERTAVAILFGLLLICGTATVFLENVGKAPFAQEYTSGSPEGSLVYIQGTVQELTPIDPGQFSLLMINGVQVFLSDSAAKVSLAEGDRITLYGIVQTYKGKREIIVSDSEDIRIIERSSGKSLHS